MLFEKKLFFVSYNDTVQDNFSRKVYNFEDVYCFRGEKGEMRTVDVS